MLHVQHYYSLQMFSEMYMSTIWLRVFSHLFSLLYCYKASELRHNGIFLGDVDDVRLALLLHNLYNTHVYITFSGAGLRYTIQQMYIYCVPHAPFYQS